MKALRPGWRWHGFTYATQSPRGWKTWRLDYPALANTILASMNSVMPFLKFIQDVGEDFSDGKLPSLDTTICVELNRIMFEFFSKPIANIIEVQATSALSEEKKLSSLAEEVNRRMRNTSRKVEQSRTLNTLEDLCTKMWLHPQVHQESFYKGP